MRRVLHLLILTAVLLCGLHVGEADTPHRSVEHQLALDATTADDASSAPSDHDGRTADAGHHHCPLASDLGTGPALCAAPRPAIPAARPVSPLASMALAPPVEPPAA